MAEKLSSAAKTPAQKGDGPGEIEPIVRKIVGDILETDPQSIDSDAQLVKDLGMDSMMALEILAAIEKRFRIKIPEDNLPKMTTITHIIQVTQQHARPA